MEASMLVGWWSAVGAFAPGAARDWLLYLGPDARGLFARVTGDEVVSVDAFVWSLDEHGRFGAQPRRCHWAGAYDLEAEVDDSDFEIDATPVTLTRTPEGGNGDVLWFPGEPAALEGTGYMYGRLDRPLSHLLDLPLW